MATKPAIFLVILKTIVLSLLSADLFAQKSQNDGAATYYSSSTDFEIIPTGRKLLYAFRSLSIASQDLELSQEDGELIKLAAIGTPPRDRTFQLFRDSCSFYYERAEQELPMETSYMAQVFQSADQLEDEDRYRFLEDIFNSMSVRGQNLVQEEIDLIQGTNKIGMLRMNWIEIEKRKPERIEAAFVGNCQKLEESFQDHGGR